MSCKKRVKRELDGMWVSKGKDKAHANPTVGYRSRKKQLKGLPRRESQSVGLTA